MWGVAAMAVVLCGLGYWLYLRSQETRLMREWPSDVPRSREMLRLAVSIARPLYTARCASCHGADLSGNRAIGAPAMANSVRLYGDGGIGDLENTILYGIRSGHPKAHNITDMPAEGRTHQLSETEVGDVVEYVLALSQQSHDEAASQRGRELFFGKGNCYDCHATDAQGNTDYGAPSLLGSTWLYGGDRHTLYDTVYSGRHGRCPAWISVLTPVQSRALAAYLYVASHPQGLLAWR
jgi:cytochrome c oxidase cbb3-type subunit 3